MTTNRKAICPLCKTKNIVVTKTNICAACYSKKRELKVSGFGTKDKPAVESIYIRPEEYDKAIQFVKDEKKRILEDIIKNPRKYLNKTR